MKTCRVVTEAVAVSFAMSLLLGGCISPGGSSERTTYYLLEFDGAAADFAGTDKTATADGASAGGQGPRVIVRDAEVSPMFDRRQLLQRLEGPMVRYLSADLWAVTPSVGIASLVREGLLESGRFGAVVRGRRPQGEFEVLTEIDALTYHCCRDEREAEAEVAGRFLLVDARNGEEITAHSFTDRHPLEEDTPRAFVEAAAAMLSAELGEFVERMPDAFE
ncbi:MAG: ABC-type transport auxiliary lipoprotein family protein [Spirochaetaceae bacterium]